MSELKTSLAARESALAVQEAALAALQSDHEITAVVAKSKSAALTQLLTPHTAPE